MGRATKWKDDGRSEEEEEGEEEEEKKGRSRHHYWPSKTSLSLKLREATNSLSQTFYEYPRYGGTRTGLQDKRLPHPAFCVRS